MTAVWWRGGKMAAWKMSKMAVGEGCKTSVWRWGRAPNLFIHEGVIPPHPLLHVWFHSSCLFLHWYLPSPHWHCPPTFNPWGTVRRTSSTSDASVQPRTPVLPCPQPCYHKVISLRWSVVPITPPLHLPPQWHPSHLSVEADRYSRLYDHMTQSRKKSMDEESSIISRLNEWHENGLMDLKKKDYFLQEIMIPKIWSHWRVPLKYEYRNHACAINTLTSSSIKCNFLNLSDYHYYYG